MLAAGCQRILLAPLYPQYCAATTATANDRAFAHLATLRWQPAIRTLPPYHDDPAYIDALRASIEEQPGGITDFDPRCDPRQLPRHATAHAGELGDPYHCHCQKTGRLLAEALAPMLAGRELTRRRSSRGSGRAKWLEPATDDGAGGELPGRGHQEGGDHRAGLSPPDCVETLEELAIRGRETFVDGGRRATSRLSGLSQQLIASGIKPCCASILARELAGWIASAHSVASIIGEADMARVAVVTGGTRGIGEAICLALKRHGHD